MTEPSANSPKIYRFGSYELEPAKFELRKEGETAKLEPKSFALLLFLVENRDRVVSKE